MENETNVAVPQTEAPAVKEVRPALDPGFIYVDAKIPDTDMKCSVTYNFGADLDSSVELFTGPVIHNSFVRSAKITLQSRLRDCLKGGGTQADCDAIAADFVPGIAQKGGFKDAKTTAENYFKNLDKEAQVAFLKDITG